MTTTQKYVYLANPNGVAHLYEDCPHLAKVIWANRVRNLPRLDLKVCSSCQKRVTA